MIEGLNNASQAMKNKLMNIQIVANNLANVNTTGFKRTLAFSEVFDQEINSEPKVLTDFSEGTFVGTDNPLNAAIAGDAFFVIKTDQGEELTRNGDFTIDNQGFLVTKEGFRVLGQNGEINLQEDLIDNSNRLKITKNGELKFDDKIINKLKIANVDEKINLIKAEGQRFYTKDRIYQLVDENKYKIHQGYIEESNTNAILEMQSMIQLQKEYEAASKMIQSIDTVMSQEKEIGTV